MFGYTEERQTANPTRKAYVDGLKAFIAKEYKSAEDKRTAYIRSIAENPEQFRQEFINMLGYPLNDKALLAEKARIEKVLLHQTSEITLYRVTITMLDTIPFTGLLFLHNDGKNHPLMFSQHGGSGSPEVCSNLFENNSGEYHDMTLRLFQMGANVFAPQLLLWSDDYKVEGFTRWDRDKLDVWMKQFGGSITALELFCYRKAIDTLCENGYADENHIGMVGMSYGGMFTLFMTAIEPRIKTALSSSYFHNKENCRFIDWSWENSAKRFMDAEIALLTYPRYLCIAVGNHDNMFSMNIIQPELDRLHTLAAEIYPNKKWFDTCVFDGDHEFIQSDEYLQKVISIVKE